MKPKKLDKKIERERKKLLRLSALYYGVLYSYKHYGTEFYRCDKLDRIYFKIRQLKIARIMSRWDVTIEEWATNDAWNEIVDNYMVSVRIMNQYQLRKAFMDSEKYDADIINMYF